MSPVIRTAFAKVVDDLPLFYRQLAPWITDQAVSETLIETLISANPRPSWLRHDWSLNKNSGGK